MSLIPKKGTIYVVDDDEAVRDSLQWLLEGKDYRVRCFDSAEIIHVENSVNPERDMDIINLELILADLDANSKKIG